MDVLELEQAENVLNGNLCKAAVCQFTRIPINGSYIAFLNQIRAISSKKKFPYGAGKQREGKRAKGYCKDTGHFKVTMSGYNQPFAEETGTTLWGAIAAQSFVISQLGITDSEKQGGSV